MSEFNWTCPFCNRAQTVSSTKYSRGHVPLYIGDNKLGQIGFCYTAIGCSNPMCKEVAVHMAIGTDPTTRGNFEATNLVSSHRLRPEFSYKVQPDYIPKNIVQDYIEACRIRYLSPKASATLARRCIQGVIRDFCKISKSRLIDEINTLKILVDESKAPSGVTIESVDAIDHVRQIGNIGAHMEKDINVIIDVDPDEAQALIELIEMLFDEWYVSRNTRLEKLARVKLIGVAKAEQKKQIETETPE